MVPCSKGHTSESEKEDEDTVDSWAGSNRGKTSSVSKEKRSDQE